MPFALVLAVAAGLAAVAYLVLERPGRPVLVPATLRALALGAVGLLLVNVSCERRRETLTPVVLLDASLSMAGAGADWGAARAEAAALGEVRLVGPVSPADSLPAGGRSAVVPAILAATAGGRPVWLVTDGELEDAALLPPDVMGRVGVRLLPRQPGPDLALTRVRLPDRVAVGDSLRVEFDVTGVDAAGRNSVEVSVGPAGARWLGGRVPLRDGAGSGVLEGPLADVPPGEYLVEIALRDAADSEPRTDLRLALVTVTPTPGVVLVASPPGWESRFLFRALQDVAALPVRGYLGLAGGEWRRMGDLGTVGADEVAAAARRADLLVLLGDPPPAVRAVPARGRWEFPATSAGAGLVEGDWYLGAAPPSPVAGAFVGLPLDSFPPATGLVPLEPDPGGWTGLAAQLNRRGPERPAVVGRDSAGRRQVRVGAAGLWRWAFRGGASEEAYRSWVAASVSWLLGGADSATGRARPVRPVVPNGRPVVFQRLRPDSAAVPIALEGPAGSRADTLRFDGEGRAELLLPPGEYRYRIDGGGRGLVAVETYSDEWLRRPVVVQASDPAAGPPPGRRPLREVPWLFALAIAALTGEWWWRRRAGLR